MCWVVGGGWCGTFHSHIMDVRDVCIMRISTLQQQRVVSHKILYKVAHGGGVVALVLLCF